MDLESLTIKDILSMKFGDEKAGQILSEVQEGIDQKLSVEELQQKVKAVAEQGGEPAVGSDIRQLQENNRPLSR